MTGRERLSNRRPHEVVGFVHNGFAFTAGVGRFPDGRLAELFLDATKSGMHGVPVDTIQHALNRDHADAPSSPLCVLLDLLAANEAAS